MKITYLLSGDIFGILVRRDNNVEFNIRWRLI
jgi:hypothetical protein